MSELQLVCHSGEELKSLGHGGGYDFLKSRGPRRLLGWRACEAKASPEVVVEVTYLTWTQDNLLRQVSYQGQREDKPARPVVRAVPHQPRGARSARRIAS